MSHQSRESKIAGCLLGGAIGDALGAPVELWTLEQILSQCGDTGVRKFLPATYGNAHGTGLITDHLEAVADRMDVLFAESDVQQPTNTASIHPMRKKSM